MYNLVKTSSKSKITMRLAILFFNLIVAKTYKDNDRLNGWDNRRLHPDLHALKTNDEILFLIGTTGDLCGSACPFGYYETGASFVARSDQPRYSDKLFDTNKWPNSYKLCTLEDFIMLGRTFVFDIQGVAMKDNKWMHSMDAHTDETRVDRKMVAMPQKWILEAESLKPYYKRRELINKWHTGASNGSLPMIAYPFYP